MKTSRVIENAQKKAQKALTLVGHNREEAMANHFKNEDWFKVASGELEIVLNDLIDDLQSAKEDVVEMEEKKPHVVKGTGAVNDQSWDDRMNCRLERLEEKPTGHDYDWKGREKR